MAHSGFVSLSSPVRSGRNSYFVFSRGLIRTSLLPFILLCTMLGFITGAMAQLPGVGPQSYEAQNGEVSVDNLNIHLDIPIVRKSGIGLPLSFSLIYNSNFYLNNGGAWQGEGSVASSNIYGWNFLDFLEAELV